MDVNIRAFSFPEDYPSVVDLWKSAGPGIHIHASDTYDEIQKKLARDPELFLVAEESTSIIGSVIGGFDGRRGMIYHLAVAPAFRGKGIGKLLMQEVENRLRALGCIRCYLLVAVDNPEVIEFYQHLGWDQMAVIPFGKNL